jgi:hypothetical protein
MKKDMHFWFTVLLRGFLALFAGSFILIIPDMARTLLLLPFAVTLSILGLGAYGVLDSVLVLVSSFMTDSEQSRMGLLAQGTLGAVFGILLLSIGYDRAQLEWFLSLAALQALTAAVGEFVAARHAATRATSLWDHAAAFIAFLTGVAYLVVRIHFAGNLTPRQISWFVYGFLVAFGAAQCLTAARMLYTDRKLLLVHPKRTAKEA